MDQGRIDFNRVAMFVQIANAGGVTAAATHLKLPKSSVSRSLSQLESELGVELVVRTSRQFRLTEAGRSFFRAASKGIATVDGARDELRRDNATPQGLVRIAAPANIATALLPPILAGFVRQHPKVEVDLRVTGQEVYPVRDGFDLVLSTEKLSDSSAKVRSIGALESGVFATANYLREFGTPRRPSELTKHECILRGRAKKADRWRLRGPDGTVVVAVTGHVRVDDPLGVVSLATAGLGLALLPVRLPIVDPGLATLQRVLPEYVVRGEAVQLLYAAQRHTPLHISMLRDAILDSARMSCTKAEHVGAEAAQ